MFHKAEEQNNQITETQDMTTASTQINLSTDNYLVINKEHLQPTNNRFK